MYRTVNNRQGGVLLIVIGIMFGLTIVTGFLQYDLISSIRGISKEKAVVNSDFVEDALLDYLLLSVQENWCVGDDWTSVTCDLPFKSDTSIRRMLLSRSALKTLGELFIVPGPNSTLNLNEWPSCAGSLSGIHLPLPAQRSTWFFNWEKCVGIGVGKTITQISQNIEFAQLPNDHKLRLLFRNHQLPDGKKYIKADVILRQADLKKYPSIGRGINLEFEVKMYTDDTETPAKTLISRLSAYPMELNQFGLVLAGKLMMDGSDDLPDANELKKMGANIPMMGLILSSVDGTYIPDPDIKGIQFESPVFINDGIVLPEKNNDRSLQKFAYVNFTSDLYLGSLEGTDQPSGVVQRGSNQTEAKFKADLGAQGLKSFMLGVQNGIQALGFDKGLNYIAGSKLSGGLSDNDSGIGALMAKCIAVKTEQTNLIYTNSSELKIETRGPYSGSLSEYFLTWQNDSLGSTIKTRNHFVSPRSASGSRGAKAKCYSDSSALNPIYPQVYDSSTIEDNNPDNTPSPAFRLFRTPGTNMLYTDNSTAYELLGTAPSLIVNPASLQFDVLRDTLGNCPKSTKNQVDALKDEFDERASVIMNVEYLLQVQDKQNLAEGFITNYDLFDQKDKTAFNLLNPKLIDQIRSLKAHFQTLFPNPVLMPDGTEAPDRYVEYSTKALMGFNTKLQTNFLKNHINAWILSETKEEDVNSIFAKMSTRINQLYSEIALKLNTDINYLSSPLSTDGVNNHAVVDDRITLLEADSVNLQSQIQTKTTGIESQAAIILSQNSRICNQVPGDEVCTDIRDISTGLVSNICTTPLVADPVCVADKTSKITSATSAKDDLTSEKTALEKRLEILNSARSVKSRIAKLDGFKTFLISLKPDLDEISARYIAIQEYFGGIPTKVGDSESNPPIGIFHPSIARLHLQKPETTNRFLRRFKFLINSFDSSYAYSVNRGRIESTCGDDEDGSTVRAWVKLSGEGSVAPNDKVCVEFKSRRSTEADTQATKSTISISVGTTPTSGGLLVETVSKNPISYDVSEVNDLPAVALKNSSLSNYSHYGLVDFACEVANQLSSFDKINALAAGHDSPIAMGIQWGIDFSRQTNQSWYFAPSNSNQAFSELSDPYGLSAAVLNLTTSSHYDATSVVPTDLKAFQVRSIMSTCIVHPEVTFLAGFFVCREFIVMPRLTPLEITGTIIAGRLTIDQSAVRSGVYFRNIYHPTSRKKLADANILKSSSDCEADSLPPVWIQNVTVQQTDNLLGCSSNSLRSRAQPFTWTKVDPDCGLIASYPNSVTGLVPERMRCKDQIDRYRIIEMGRSK